MLKIRFNYQVYLLPSNCPPAINVASGVLMVREFLLGTPSSHNTKTILIFVILLEAKFRNIQIIQRMSINFIIQRMSINFIILFITVFKCCAFLLLAFFHEAGIASFLCDVHSWASSPHWLTLSP